MYAETSVQKETSDLWGHKVFKEILDLWDRKEILALSVRKEILVLWVLLDQKEKRVTKESAECKANRGLWGNKDLKERPAHRDHRAIWAAPGPKGNKDL